MPANGTMARQRHYTFAVRELDDPAAIEQCEVGLGDDCLRCGVFSHYAVRQRMNNPR